MLIAYAGSLMDSKALYVIGEAGVAVRYEIVNVIFGYYESCYDSFIRVCMECVNLATAHQVF